MLAIAPLLFDRIRLLQIERSDRVAAASQVAISIARRSAQLQQDIVTAARAVMHVAGRGYAAAAPAGDGCNQFLNGLIAGVPWIKSLSITGTDARIACSTLPNAIGANLSDRPYFQRAWERDEFVVGDYVVARTQQEPTIVALLPVAGLAPGARAMMIAGIDLQWIGRLAAAVEGHQGAMALLVDGSGLVIAGRPDSPEWLGHRLADEVLAGAILARPEGSVTAARLDGVPRIFGFAQVPGTDAHVVVGLTEQEVLGRIDRETLIAFVQLGFVCMIVLIGVWFGGEQLIVEPVRALARSAGRIGRGNLDAKLGNHPWAAEFAPLAAALDNMARMLAAREEDLHVANSHLERLVKIDGLSGLANRRGFDAALDAEWRRAESLGQPLALLMIDVDHFKLFNDNYGHLEGDECLRAIGAVIGVTAALGSYPAARYGGEEFAVLVPGADVEPALVVAERLRVAVAGLRVAHAASSTGYATISIGVASIRPAPDRSPQTLIEAADEALYAAKHRGRNTAVPYSPAGYSVAC